MENKKLFVMDLDGTALLNFITLHPRTIEGVKHVISKGHKVVIATGRSLCACIKFYDELKLDTPAITSNGSVLTNPCDDKFKGWNRLVNKNLIEYILSDEIINKIQNIYYYANNKIYLHEYNEIMIEKLLQTGCEVVVENLTGDSLANSIALIVKNDKLSKIRECIKNNFKTQDFNSWDGNYHESYVEVNPDDTNKWNGVEEIAKYYKIDHKNIYTFGDADNDYYMIKNCENSVVMKNATHKLKSVGNYVSPLNNTEGAVGEFLLSIE